MSEHRVSLLEKVLAIQLRIKTLASKIDHTMLKPDATPAEIEELCAEAKKYHFASVCVNPGYVSLCSSLLKETEVRVCTVVGFPLGANTIEVKEFETEQAIQNGATEIDMVINVGRLKAGIMNTLKRMSHGLCK